MPDRHADPSQGNRPTEIDVLPGVRPLSNLSSSSGNTEESLSTFAEQTLHHLAQMDSSLDVTFLSAPSKGFPQGEAGPHPPKVSESEALSASQSGTEQANISDETVKSSLHAMRSLVLHAVHGGKGHTTGQLRKALIRGSLPARATSASSEGESDSEGYTTDGYTSGAYETDEDIAGTILGQEVDSDASTSATQTLATRRENVTSHSGDVTIPSPGYSEGDYEPLCQMCPQTKHQHSKVSPPQKRRKLQPRPGKVMKSSYFKGIQWTKVFVTGPLDPVHNKHKFYCQICKTNVSIYSKGAREIIRHYSSEGHLRRDQRWRFEHLGKVDKISGNVIHSVRGRNGHILTPFELEKEKPLVESVPLVDIGPRFPFYDEYMSSAGGLTNFEDIRSGTQISLIGRFVPYFGDLATLQGLWTEVGNFTNHQELFGNLDWSSTRLTVCVALTDLIFNYGFGEKRGRIHNKLSILYILLSKNSVSGYFPSRFPTRNGGCAQTVNDSGLYSIEFEPQGSKEIAPLRYWKLGFLVKLQLFQYSLAADPLIEVNYSSWHDSCHSCPQPPR